MIWFYNKMVGNLTSTVLQDICYGVTHFHSLRYLISTLNLLPKEFMGGVEVLSQQEPLKVTPFIVDFYRRKYEATLEKKPLQETRRALSTLG